MKQLLITILLALSMAHAYTPENVRDLAANDLDGITAECPQDEVFADAACFTLDSSMQLAKLQIELFASKYNDVQWITPWGENNNVLSRMMVIDKRDGTQFFYGFFILRQGDWDVKVAVFQLQ